MAWPGAGDVAVPARRHFPMEVWGDPSSVVVEMTAEAKLLEASVDD